MPTERKRAVRTAAAWSANQAEMEALYGVGNYYTTLSAWEAGEQANLTTLDEIRTAVCYNDWPSGLSDELDINGWTTDATRYVRVTVAEGHRHNGTPGSGFHVRKESTGSSLLLNRHAGTRVEWVDFEQQSTATTKYGARAFSATGVVFYACIGRTQTASDLGAFGADTGGAFTAQLCIAHGSRIGFSSAGGAQTFQNCVAYGCIVGYGTNAAGTSGAGNSKNCVAYDCSTRGFSSSWNFYSTCSNDASSDTSAGWTGCVTSITSAAFVNAAANDFHLSSGSVLRGAGVNLYSDFTTDIDGDTWPSSDAWDIGFDYYVAAGGSLTIDSITASNITSSGARITLGVTR